MKPKPPTRLRVAPAIRFRQQIEMAESDGLARVDMTLRLTRGDASLLKRDRSLAVCDISFADGAMRFLGVLTEEGGVTESELVTASPAA